MSRARRRQTVLRIGEVPVVGFGTTEEILQKDFPSSYWMREDNRSFLILKTELEVWEK